MWNHRVIKTKINDQEIYKVVEVYYDNETGKIKGWADRTDTILMSDEYEDLKWTAEHVLKAFEKPILYHIPEKNNMLFETEEG